MRGAHPAIRGVTRWDATREHPDYEQGMNFKQANKRAATSKTPVGATAEKKRSP
jgi:hypothetical protein